MILHITDAQYLRDYTILFEFSNGAKKEVDLSILLKYPAFQFLKDKAEFVRFGLRDTIFWSNGADIAPEFLLENGIDV